MEYRYMGRTGLRVSELCLGAMHFGGDTDEETSVAILDAFAEAGGTFIDTADAYHSGASEEILGRWLKGRDRDKLVIATKVFWGPGGNDHGLSRKHLVKAVEASLRRLGTDHIDVYYTHFWDPVTPLEETLGALDLMVKAGKVRYLGASNLTGWQLQKSIDTSLARGWEPYTALQPLYNMLDREVEWELAPICANEGLGLMPWSPLRAGWLAGRFHRGMQAPPEGTRIANAKVTHLEKWELYANERTWRVLDELHAVAAETGRPALQVALRWLMQTPGVTAPIIGPRTFDHYTGNIAASGWSLTGEHMARLNAASDKPKVYPYDIQDLGLDER
ncbi:aldo/keto reductase [Actinorhabdospora filicis]|uniref:aldo/keto reductase n=1 Tax=Actinorhabdospora filicis TaxID=1785913 RepID=UPI00255655DC|nr:aldo/keto reductase [Actinorhabdospora filicis]